VKRSTKTICCFSFATRAESDHSTLTCPAVSTFTILYRKRALFFVLSCLRFASPLPQLTHSLRLTLCLRRSLKCARVVVKSAKVARPEKQNKTHRETCPLWLRRAGHFENGFLCDRTHFGCRAVWICRSSVLSLSLSFYERSANRQRTTVVLHLLPTCLIAVALRTVSTSCCVHLPPCGRAALVCRSPPLWYVCVLGAHQFSLSVLFCFVLFCFVLLCFVSSSLSCLSRVYIRVCGYVYVCMYAFICVSVSVCSLRRARARVSDFPSSPPASLGYCLLLCCSLVLVVFLPVPLIYTLHVVRSFVVRCQCLPM
jgi:hypothetical protein